VRVRGRVRKVRAHAISISATDPRGVGIVEWVQWRGHSGVGAVAWA
jgi:hypothetical protein